VTFTNIQLWQQGTMLHESWKLTCDPIVRTRIEEIGVEVLEIWGRNPQFRMLESALSLFSKANPDLSNSQLIEKLHEAREEVVTDLYNEELIGIGQTGLHSTSRRYDLIQAEFWYDVEPDWDADAARSVDREYVRIRVIDPYKYPQFSSRRGRGRPGVRDKLFETLDYLSAHKIIDVNSATHKEIHREILNYFQIKNPNEFNVIERLEISTIRKAITAYRNR